MRQVWSDLLFLHWEVAEHDLRALVPAELEVDTYGGRAFVGLVPFGMSGVRPVFVPPLPGLSRFLEVNVRTYVRCRVTDEPGVWFFSLDAANRPAVWGARTLWHLPYHFARMRLDRAEARDPTRPAIRYASQRVGSAAGSASCDIAYTPAGSLVEAHPGTLDHFLIERYVFFAKKRHRLYRGVVAHAPYRTQGAVIHELDESLIAAAGLGRSAQPPLIHFVPGVDVRIRPIRRVRA